MQAFSEQKYLRKILFSDFLFYFNIETLHKTHYTEVETLDIDIKTAHTT